LIKLVSTVDRLVFYSQNNAKLVKSSLQPRFYSLAEVYMYVSFTAYDHSTVLGQCVRNVNRLEIGMRNSSTKHRVETFDAIVCAILAVGYIMRENDDN